MLLWVLEMFLFSLELSRDRLVEKGDTDEALEGREASLLMLPLPLL